MLSEYTQLQLICVLVGRNVDGKAYNRQYLSRPIHLDPPRPLPPQFLVHGDILRTIKQRLVR
jgi:hypothetical protein